MTTTLEPHARVYKSLGFWNWEVTANGSIIEHGFGSLFQSAYSGAEKTLSDLLHPRDDFQEFEHHETDWHERQS